MTKTGLLKLVRLNCCECMGGPRASEGIWPVSQMDDIAGCTSPQCAFYPYRFGKDPVKSQKRVEMGRRNVSRLRSGLKSSGLESTIAFTVCPSQG